MSKRLLLPALLLVAVGLALSMPIGASLLADDQKPSLPATELDAPPLPEEPAAVATDPFEPLLRRIVQEEQAERKLIQETEALYRRLDDLPAADTANNSDERLRVELKIKRMEVEHRLQHARRDRLNQQLDDLIRAEIMKEAIPVAHKVIERPAADRPYAVGVGIPADNKPASKSMTVIEADRPGANVVITNGAGTKISFTRGVFNNDVIRNVIAGCAGGTVNCAVEKTASELKVAQDRLTARIGQIERQLKSLDRERATIKNLLATSPEGDSRDTRVKQKRIVTRLETIDRRQMALEHQHSQLLRTLKSLPHGVRFYPDFIEKSQSFSACAAECREGDAEKTAEVFITVEGNPNVDIVRVNADQPTFRTQDSVFKKELKKSLEQLEREIEETAQDIDDKTDRLRKISKKMHTPEEGQNAPEILIDDEVQHNIIKLDLRHSQRVYDDLLKRRQHDLERLKNLADEKQTAAHKPMQGVSIINKIPYISRLYANTGVAQATEGTTDEHVTPILEKLPNLQTALAAKGQKLYINRTTPNVGVPVTWKNGVRLFKNVKGPSVLQISNVPFAETESSAQVNAHGFTIRLTGDGQVSAVAVGEKDNEEPHQAQAQGVIEFSTNERQQDGKQDQPMVQTRRVKDDFPELGRQQERLMHSMSRLQHLTQAAKSLERAGDDELARSLREKIEHLEREIREHRQRLENATKEAFAKRNAANAMARIGVLGRGLIQEQDSSGECPECEVVIEKYMGGVPILNGRPYISRLYRKGDYYRAERKRPAKVQIVGFELDNERFQEFKQQQSAVSKMKARLEYLVLAAENFEEAGDHDLEQAVLKRASEMQELIREQQTKLKELEKELEKELHAQVEASERRSPEQSKPQALHESQGEPHHQKAEADLRSAYLEQREITQKLAHRIEQLIREANAFEQGGQRGQLDVVRAFRKEVQRLEAEMREHNKRLAEVRRRHGDLGNSPAAATMIRERMAEREHAVHTHDQLAELKEIIGDLRRDVCELREEILELREELAEADDERDEGKGDEEQEHGEGDRDEAAQIRGKLRLVIPAEEPRFKIGDAVSVIADKWRGTTSSTASETGDNVGEKREAMRIDAKVTQILPNGNLRIRGRRIERNKGRVGNYDMKISAIVRPDAISPDHTVNEKDLTELEMAKSFNSEERKNIIEDDIATLRHQMDQLREEILQLRKASDDKDDQRNREPHREGAVQLRGGLDLIVPAGGIQRDGNVVPKEHDPLELQFPSEIRKNQARRMRIHMRAPATADDAVEAKKPTKANGDRAAQFRLKWLFDTPTVRIIEPGEGWPGSGRMRLEETPYRPSILGIPLDCLRGVLKDNVSVEATKPVSADSPKMLVQTQAAAAGDESVVDAGSTFTAKLPRLVMEFMSNDIVTGTKPSSEFKTMGTPLHQTVNADETFTKRLFRLRKLPDAELTTDSIGLAIEPKEPRVNFSFGGVSFTR